MGYGPGRLLVLGEEWSQTKVVGLRGTVIDESGRVIQASRGVSMATAS